MERERDEGGKYVEEVTLDRVLGIFDEADLPVLTSKEIAEALDCSQSAAYNKLEELVEVEELQKKKVGSRAVVYVWDEDTGEGG